MRDTKGITLIALVVTIIVLLILAGVTITILTGENRLLKRAQEAVQKTEIQEKREILELVLQEALIEKVKNKEYNSNEFLDKFIKTRITETEINDNIVKIGNYEFVIDREKLKIISSNNIEENNVLDKNTSLIGAISKISKSGYEEIELTVKLEDDTEGEEEKDRTTKYGTHIIVKNGDLVLDGINNVDGATLEENVYEFGDKTTDVATETEDAKNMVILKVNGNLTINDGITLTACKSDNGYGGPKGLFIYCTGTIINNGTISMTARGARAEGQNVYLWQNKDESYEYVPAIGATGGNDYTSSSKEVFITGNKGNDGTERKTGGGGSGGAKHGDSSGYSYAFKGGNGTSYSGGTGSGGINENSKTGPTIGGSTTDNGGMRRIWKSIQSTSKLGCKTSRWRYRESRRVWCCSYIWKQISVRK